MRIVPVLFIAVIAGIGLAIKYLPWWGLLLAAAGVIVIGKFVIKRLFFRLLLKPFQLKGAVLKGAKVEIHSITPAIEPPLKEAASSESPERARYHLEVTIHPGNANTPFGAWEPGELRLVRPESVLDMNPDTPSDNDDTCEIESIEVQEDGAFKPDEGMKFPGAQRLKLLLAVKPGASRLKFRYYFEEFGSVALPAAITAKAA